MTLVIILVYFLVGDPGRPGQCGAGGFVAPKRLPRGGAGAKGVPIPHITLIFPWTPPIWPFLPLLGASRGGPPCVAPEGGLVGLGSSAPHKRAGRREGQLPWAGRQGGGHVSCAKLAPSSPCTADGTRGQGARWRVPTAGRGGAPVALVLQRLGRLL